MKKVIGILLGLVMLVSAACAEEITAALWQHDGGWMAFSLAMMREELNETWDKGAKVFGESVGFTDLTGAQLRDMTLQGYAMTDGLDELQVEGNRFTGRTRDGEEVFSHEYAFVETIEGEGILGGAKVHVFQTKEKKAGEYTYLLLTEPIRNEGEKGSYVTFNLFHTKGKYKNFFKGKTTPAPSAMIEKDTTLGGLEQVIETLYLTPVGK